MKPTRPSEATLIRPRAFEGHFLVGTAGLVVIEYLRRKVLCCRKGSGAKGPEGITRLGEVAVGLAFVVKKP